MIKEEENGTYDKGDQQRAFVKLSKTILDEVCIPQQMCWMIIIDIPKRGSNHHGIVLIEPFWKAIEVCMDKRLSKISFHHNLHGFLKGRDMRTASLKAKLAQQLAIL